jgi:N utilization substance protein A
MAAQTAKQVIIQRLREVERNNIFEEYKDKQGEVITGVVQRREGRVILVDIGKTTAIITPEGQVAGEAYAPNSRIKAYVESVGMGPKGPEIILSRTSTEIVKKVFYLEIPEIGNGLIDLHGVAREPGSRSKVAVAALEENVDPIGSCVGQRGARIQTIISELGGEKVDIIEYSEDAKEFISHALAPAKVIKVELDEEERKAVVYVASDQLSLAIGKGGQNVRLAAKLTGWKIDIKEITGDGETVEVASSDGETVEKEGEARNDELGIKNEEAGDDAKKSEEEVSEGDGEENVEAVKEVKEADEEVKDEEKEEEKKKVKADKKEEDTEDENKEEVKEEEGDKEEKK